MYMGSYSYVLFVEFYSYVHVCRVRSKFLVIVCIICYVTNKYMLISTRSNHFNNNQLAIKAHGSESQGQLSSTRQINKLFTGSTTQKFMDVVTELSCQKSYRSVITNLVHSYYVYRINIPTME